MKQVGKTDTGPTQVWGRPKKVTMGETQEAMVRHRLSHCENPSAQSGEQKSRDTKVCDSLRRMPHGYASAGLAAHGTPQQALASIPGV